MSTTQDELSDTIDRIIENDQHLIPEKDVAKQYIFFKKSGEDYKKIADQYTHNSTQYLKASETYRETHDYKNHEAMKQYAVENGVKAAAFNRVSNLYLSISEQINKDISNNLKR